MTSTHLPTDHVHSFNFHTGRPRFHFNEGGDPPAPPPAPPPSPAPPPATSWNAGIDAELLGHAQLKGWKLDDPKEAFTAATKQARDLEKHFGVPADRLLKIPAADAKPEDLRAYYERLGAPKEAKDYDLSSIKDVTIAETLRATLHDKGIAKDAAAAVAASVAKALESKATTETVLDTGKLAEQRMKLEQDWGGKDSATWQLNQLNAMEGARRLGISPEAVKAMENQIGYDQVMEAMRKIGKHTREDTFVERGGQTVGDVTTMEGAVARKSDLMADPAWTKRYMDGGMAERREMDRLNQMITGVVA